VAWLQWHFYRVGLKNPQTTVHTSVAMTWRHQRAINNELVRSFYAIWHKQIYLNRVPVKSQMQISGLFSTKNPRKSWPIPVSFTRIQQQELQIFHCLCPSWMLKQRVVSQLYTNYIKLLHQWFTFSAPHSKISWLFQHLIRNISGPKKSKYECQYFSEPRGNRA